MLDEIIHNFEGVRADSPNLVQSEPVQPLQDNLDLILPKEFLYEFRCAEFSQRTASARKKPT